ncbi:hypothetical protein KCP78_22240 [Salmonella enterica subsp. enterica]|nr:hypothetical protein KCP78_22240 [Salmonella enterica subsp. enterica]
MGATLGKAVISAAHTVTFIALETVPADRQRVTLPGILHYDALLEGWLASQTCRRSGVLTRRSWGNG